MGLNPARINLGIGQDSTVLLISLRCVSFVASCVKCSCPGQLTFRILGGGTSKCPALPAHSHWKYGANIAERQFIPKSIAR